MNSIRSGRTVVPANPQAGSRMQGILRRHDTARSDGTPASRDVLREFAEFAGSPSNAALLVTGLAWGVPITLTALARNGWSRSSMTFKTPSGPLRDSDVYACLTLVKRQLADLGITHPAPEHIKAALVGGVVVDTDGTEWRTLALTGVLTLRSQGMSWGAVAASQGITLGSW